MSDNVTFQTTAATPASGTVVATDEVQVGGTQAAAQVQFIKLVDGTLNGTDPISGTSANGLDVDVTRIAAGDNNIGNVDLASAIPAGSNTIGGVMDAGPSVEGTPTYTTSTDMTTAADIGPAPTGGQKSVLLQVTISAAVALEFTLQMETTPGAERVSFFLPANGFVVFIPRHPIKLGTANKKWQGKASIAGNVRIHTTVRSEA